MNNNLHAVVVPFAVFGIAEEPFAVFFAITFVSVTAVESSATPTNYLVASVIPFPEIMAPFASNFLKTETTSFNLFFRDSGILAPFEPVWKLS